MHSLELRAIADAVLPPPPSPIGVAVGGFDRADDISSKVYGDVSEGHLFQIGSVTKPITALLLAESAIRGELALDESVNEYLPSGTRLRTHPEGEISIRHLATHCGCLPRVAFDWLPDMILLRRNPYRRITRRRVLRSINRVRPFSWPLGSKPEYSNLGFAILGVVLEHATGADYESLLRDRIAGPLGLMCMTTEPDSLPNPPAQGHDAAGRIVPAWSSPGVAAVGGVWSTIGDLLRFVHAHAYPSGLLGDALRLVQVPIQEWPEHHVAMSLAWQHRLSRDRRVLWHDGATGGFCAFAAFASSGEGLVAVSNVGLPVTLRSACFEALRA